VSVLRGSESGQARTAPDSHAGETGPQGGTADLASTVAQPIKFR